MRRKSFDWEKFAQNKFNSLLIVIIFLFIATPFLPARSADNLLPIASIVYSLTVLAILKVLMPNKRLFYIYCAIIAVAFLLELFVSYSGATPLKKPLAAVAQLIRIGMFVIFILRLLKHIFSTKKVTGDTIKGAICAYILLGVAWAFAYRLIQYFDPSAFSLRTYEHWNFSYFSFTTLTTLGYGDIVPISTPAMMLANLEAIIGQLYITILIARLVGLHIAQAYQSNK